MERPHWMLDEEGIVEVKTQDPYVVITYYEKGWIGMGGISQLNLYLNTSLEEVNMVIDNPMSMVNRSVWSYLSSLRSFNEWSNSALSMGIQCQLAISTLSVVMSYVLENGSEEELKDVVRTVTFISQTLEEIDLRELIK